MRKQMFRGAILAFVIGSFLFASTRESKAGKPSVWPDGAQPLTTEGADEWNPVWSSDGAVLAYHTYRYASPDIFSLELRTGKQTPLIVFHTLPTAFRWIDAGTQLIFGRPNRGAGKGTTWDALTRVSREDGRPFSYDLRGTTWYGWDLSADGKLLVAAGYATKPDKHFFLRLFDPRTGEFNDLGLYFPTGMWTINELAVSADHTQCALIAEPGRGRDQEVFVVALDSPDGRVRRLTEDGGEKRNPAWSPDGQTLAYLKKQPRTPSEDPKSEGSRTSRRQGDVHALYMIPAKGGQAKLVLGGRQSVDAPCWHPSGAQIVCSAGYGKEWHIVSMNVGTGHAKVLTQGAGRDFAPACSPDGTQIAFVSDRTGDLDIFRLSFKGEGS